MSPEHVALLEALQCALGLKAKTLHVFSDSEVVVKQMRGEYSCRSPRLYSLNWICRKLARSLDFSISHVRRENTLRPIVWPPRPPATRKRPLTSTSARSSFGIASQPHGCQAVAIRWDEKAGLRRDAIRSQVIDALEAQEIKETGNEED